MLQKEPDFDVDIKEDVEDECSKYGRVDHIYVDRLVFSIKMSLHTWLSGFIDM